MTGLYLHIPFCRRKCSYCDFFSRADQSHLLPDYHRMLLSQFRLARDGGWQTPFDTVFFGGGTPSLLQPRQVAEILDVVTATVGLSASAEISLEANPGTLTQDRLAGYRAAGVNRLSLGVQSFDERILQRLGRQHDRNEALAAIETIRKAGFANLNLDLMFALPGQTTSDLASDLQQLLSCMPEHLAVYGLTIEERTPFAEYTFAGDSALPDEDRFAEMYGLIHDCLTSVGLAHYEISNFARSGYECRHNLNYWQRGPYLGLGAGAHSFSPAGWGMRRAVPDDLELYRTQLDAGSDPAVLLEEFSCREAMIETAYLGLRTARGIPAEEFRRRFDFAFEEAFPATIEKLAGHLKLEAGHWRFPVSDWLIYDHLIAEFF